MDEQWKRTALIVMGMQKDFVYDYSPMQQESSKTIIPNIKKAVQVARERGIFVIWVVREHDEQGRDVELFRRHRYAADKEGPVIKGSTGSEVIDELVIEKGDYKVIKTRFSAFFATNLHSLLSSNGIDSLVVTGIQTPNCIRQTAFDAVALDYKSVTVIVDATAALTPEVHAANIYDMKKIRIETPTLSEWCD